METIVLEQWQHKQSAVPSSHTTRSIFLVYRQLDGLIDTSRMPRASRCDWMPRARFSVRKFAQLHGLNQPTAVNFFLTQFDASVPQTISQCLRAKP